MISTIDEKAYAKLNISLDVAGKREDGYHNMVMVMQSISLCDDIHIELNESGRICARSNFRFVPEDERNLAVKAAKTFFAKRADTKSGAVISIKKHIPVGSGMGGGSADAAAVLRALNRAFGFPYSTEELAQIGAEVGSDVPFCVVGGTAFVQGRGEIITPLPPFPKCKFVICKPSFSISTPELFKKLDGVPNRRHPDTAGIMEALGTGELSKISRRMYNVFEEVNDRRFRRVSEIKSVLLDRGALGAVMTGTGSAVFGVFDNSLKAEDACAALKKERIFCCIAECV